MDSWAKDSTKGQSGRCGGCEVLHTTLLNDVDERLLGAGTGTKDSKVSMILFAQALALPSMIDTLLGATLKALAAHEESGEGHAKWAAFQAWQDTAKRDAEGRPAEDGKFIGQNCSAIPRERAKDWRRCVFRSGSGLIWLHLRPGADTARSEILSVVRRRMERHNGPAISNGGMLCQHWNP